MKVSKSKGLTISLLFLFLISACSDGGGSSDSGGTGTLSASLTDSAGSYKAVYITVESLEVHTGGNDNNKNNWETIPMDTDTINLCELTNGVFEKLGSIRLDTGKYTQMRLHLSEDPENTDELNILSQIHPVGNYVILEDNTVHELKIPSGYQTGVKLVKGFTINDNQTTEIILDFDASRSVVEAGNSGQWLLKPTIKVGELKEYSIIEGMVTDSEDRGIPDAMVSAQYFDGSESDAKDKVIVQAATITDDNGDYSLFVKPDSYNLVAYADDKEFDIRRITTTEGDDPTIADFQLNDATTGTINGTVEISGASIDEQYATISYRVLCPAPECGPDEMIEIDSINVLNTYDYAIELPTDSYNRVASTFGYDTQTATVDAPGTDNIDF
jgi:hypothetical protein